VSAATSPTPPVAVKQTGIPAGAVLQAVTVLVSVGSAIFATGQWVGEIRADLKAEIAARLEASDRIKQEIIDRQGDMTELRANYAAMVAQLGRIDHAYQRIYSLAQPQPRQRKD
jgi:hypothetical protein